MNFNPINTQEEFDARVTELYGDVAGLQAQLNTITQERDTHAGTITQLQSRLKGYETKELKHRIAREKKIPAEFSDRLTGETEQELYADAENLAGMVRAMRGPAPGYDPENGKKSENAALENMLSELRGE